MKHNLLFYLFLFLFTGSVFGQKQNVTGKVVDASDGSGLPGVSIVIRGTSTGTISNADGQFTLEAESGAVLQFSMVGFATQEYTVNNASEITIQLETDITQLSEVVVIGYGTVKKEDATGAVAAVSEEGFNKGAIATPSDLIAGKVAGVQVTSGGGAPGSGGQIRIRGGASLSASNAPLIVVDDMVLDNGGVAGMRNPLNAINPNDIASFTVLKDASATAIYGSRASNGVIIITTKKGRAGDKMSLTYNGNVSTSASVNRIKSLDATQFRTLVEDTQSQAAIDGLGSANTNWQDEVMNENFINTDHSLGAMGSFKNIPYRLSLGYTSQEGLIKTSKLERTSVSVALNPSFFQNKLKLDLNYKGTKVNNRFADQGALAGAIVFDPTQAVRDENAPEYGGYFTWKDPSGNRNTLAPGNPVALLDLRNNTSEVFRHITNLKAAYDIPFVKGLKATANLGLDYTFSDGIDETSDKASWAENAADGNGSYKEYSESKRNRLMDFYLDYNKTLSSIDSKISATAGYSYQHFWRETAAETTYDYSKEIEKSTSPARPSERYLISVFGRLNYDFKEKYLLTLTWRRDHTSAFYASNNAYGDFPSVALAWKMKKENFLVDSKTISNMKMRFGYGLTGQQDIGNDYIALARYTYGLDNAAYQMGDIFVNTLRPEGYNPNIKWEETSTLNLGLDFELFNSRINGSIDVYNKTSNDLLNFIAVPAGSNLTNAIDANVGQIENKGVELALSTFPISKSEFIWELGFNMTYNINKINQLINIEDPNYPGVATGGIAGGVGNTIQVHKVGESVSSFYVYEQVYNDQGMPVEGVYVDRNGDGSITVEDKYVYNAAAPDMFFGINTNLDYKNWNFSFSGRANLGNYVYNNVNSLNSVYNRVYPNNYTSNVTTDIYNTEFNQEQYWSDYYVKNASFFRMDNISLAYNFKSIIGGKADLRVYTTVQNAFVITDYDGLDPEISGGIDNNFYPRPRTFLFGVKVDF